MDIGSLKIITNDTIKEIRKFDIVTPELFKNTFMTKAQEHNISIDLEKLKNDTVDITLHKVYEIEKNTKENTKLLQENIDLATTAINEQDSKLLNRVQEQMKELNRRISMLEEQVYMDELTKVYNRKWLFEKFLIDEKFIKNGTIIFIDIDKFKEINDTYGHVTGDKVLAMIAQLTKKLSNAHTIRYGGDEFLVISFESAYEKLLEQTKNLSTQLMKKLFIYQGNTFKVKISYGICEFKAGDKFQDIIEIVDKKMYQQKKDKIKT